MTPFEIFKQDPQPTGWPTEPPEPPPWRRFPQPAADGEQPEAEAREDQQAYRGRTYIATDDEVRAVNAAIHLRRPLLLTGDPGCGKSSLAYAIAWRLQLGEVLYWGINSQTTIKDGLYRYDAISRLRDANLRKARAEGVQPGRRNRPRYVEPIENYLSLGPLGTALAPRAAGDRRPRVLLIDELDKSDVDLPNDLLDLFEEGSFDIDELARIAQQRPAVRLRTAYRQTSASDELVEVRNGHVQCREFPIVVITSNQERQFPPAFLRRCLRHDVRRPEIEQLRRIVQQHGLRDQDELIERFLKQRDEGSLNANDQLLSALYLLNTTDCGSREELLEMILRDLRE